MGTGYKLINRSLLRSISNFSFLKNKDVFYVQGQEPEERVREYFYYINHQGMLFLDDARIKNFTSCFKEKAFLRFFFKQLKINNTDRYPEFPYLSICGRERNFIRCDDYPIVFTHVLDKDGEKLLSYNHGNGLLTVKFEPEKIYMVPSTGRVYHPAPERYGSIGLIHSKLSIELSSRFTFRNGEGRPPTHFDFEGKTYQMDFGWYDEAVKKSKN